MTRRGYLTAQAIAKAKPRGQGERWLSDDIGERGAGRLAVRLVAAKDGTINRLLYFRYVAAGRRVSIPLGVFAPEAKPGALTLEQARAKVGELRALHRTEEGRDVRAHLERREQAKRAAEETARERLEQERRAEEGRARYTLEALAGVYVADLRRRGKLRSAQDAKNIFRNHLAGQPIGQQPAGSVTPRDITGLLRTVTEAGKGRTAAKLRAYLRAAYAVAIRAELDPAAPAAFLGFGLEVNPVAPVGSLAEYSRARDRTLSEAELRAYWRRLDAIASPSIRGGLKLALLLGGQRPAQLLRLKRADVDLAAGSVTLHDAKGARRQPRPHELPLVPEALKVIAPLVTMAEEAGCEWVFTTDGKAPVHPDTLTAEARRISAAMTAAGETREPFILSDVRRTVETLLAAAGVSKDVRAQLLSHGLGGVQAKHYDRHEYRDEKLAAIRKLVRMLHSPSGEKVVPLKGKRHA